MNPQGSVRVTLVTAPACHFCEDAHRELAGLVEGGAAVQLDVVDATSEAGARLLRTHRAAMNPLVLVDGAYFSAGRFPRRKFRALLTANTQEARHG